MRWPRFLSNLTGLMGLYRDVDDAVHEQTGKHLHELAEERIEAFIAERRKRRIDPLLSAYAILGIGQDASNTAVTQAYRRMAKIHHPDKGGTEAKFREVKTAYDFIRRARGMK